MTALDSGSPGTEAATAPPFLGGYTAEDAALDAAEEARIEAEANRLAYTEARTILDNADSPPQDIEYARRTLGWLATRSFIAPEDHPEVDADPLGPVVFTEDMLRLSYPPDRDGR